MQQTVSDVVHGIANRLIQNLQLHTHESRIYGEVFKAARIMFGVADDEELDQDSRYNIPAVILTLQDSSHQGKIAGHVIRTLYDDGYIAEEGFLLGIKDLAKEQQEKSNDDN